METWQLPKRTEADFRHAQLGLMPRGFAWFLGIAGNWWKLFTAFSIGFSAVYQMFCNLVREMSPYTTTSLTDWERELGLPKKGLAFDGDALRKSEIIRIARKMGGCSKDYIKSIAELFGLDVDVLEYWKEDERDAFDGVDFGNQDPNFFVIVRSDIGVINLTYARCSGDYGAEDELACDCNSRLMDFGDSNYEAVLTSVSPAHVKMLFVYGGS
jgi:uncharacterized protein YmfQ (DUF2313 family)